MKPIPDFPLVGTIRWSETAINSGSLFSPLVCANTIASSIRPKQSAHGLVPDVAVLVSAGSFNSFGELMELKWSAQGRRRRVTQIKAQCKVSVWLHSVCTKGSATSQSGFHLFFTSIRFFSVSVCHALLLWFGKWIMKVNYWMYFWILQKLWLWVKFFPLNLINTCSLPQHAETPQSKHAAQMY